MQTDAELFKSLLDQSPEPIQAASGTIVRGQVQLITRDGAWIDFGGKCEGLVRQADMTTQPLAIGASTDFYVLTADHQSHGYPLLSQRWAAVWTELQNAKRDNKTVRVLITGMMRNARGSVSGATVRHLDLPGFIPAGLLGANRQQMPVLVGTEQEVKVANVDLKTQKLIFDRQAALIESAFAKLRTGDVVNGFVINTVSYGVFIDISQRPLRKQVIGLLHKAEYAGNRQTQSEQLKKGKVVKVKIIDIRTRADGKKLVDLSMKDVLKAEREAFIEHLQTGSILSGTITAKTGYGVFVELAPQLALNGLLHNNQIENKLQPHGADLTIGQKIQVKILSRDAAKQRIELSTRGLVQSGQS